MGLSPHERDVNRYYDHYTQSTYLQGWDPEHLHLGLFDPAREAPALLMPGDRVRFVPL